MQVFSSSDDETFDRRAGKQSVDIAITTKEDIRTESLVRWQDSLVIEEGGGGSTFSIVYREPENGREHGPLGHKEAQPLRFVCRVRKEHGEAVGWNLPDRIDKGFACRT